MLQKIYFCMSNVKAHSVMYISLVTVANELHSTGATAANTTTKTERQTNPAMIT
jgi:hypothetical protein